MGIFFEAFKVFGSFFIKGQIKDIRESGFFNERGNIMFGPASIQIIEVKIWEAFDASISRSANFAMWKARKAKSQSFISVKPGKFWAGSTKDFVGRVEGFSQSLFKAAVQRSQVVFIELEKNLILNDRVGEVHIELIALNAVSRERAAAGIANFIAEFALACFKRSVEMLELASKRVLALIGKLIDIEIRGTILNTRNGTRINDIARRTRIKATSEKKQIS